MPFEYRIRKKLEKICGYVSRSGKSRFPDFLFNWNGTWFFAELKFNNTLSKDEYSRACDIILDTKTPLFLIRKMRKKKVEVQAIGGMGIVESGKLEDFLRGKKSTV